MITDITIKALQQSLAAAIRRIIKRNIKIYTNPNQQDTEIPCFFINLMSGSGVKSFAANSSLRSFNVDIEYLEDFNITDLQDRYLEIAEALDRHLIIFRYASPGCKAVYLRTQEPNWSWDLSGFHYKFHVDVPVRIVYHDALLEDGEWDAMPMQRIHCSNTSVKEAKNGQ